MYLDGKTDLDIKNNSKKLKELGLSKEEWRKACNSFYESCSDRTFTSESPVHTDAWVYHYILIDQLAKSDQLDVL